jgi:hypothetical protein
VSAFAFQGVITYPPRRSTTAITRRQFLAMARMAPLIAALLLCKDRDERRPFTIGVSGIGSNDGIGGRGGGTD